MHAGFKKESILPNYSEYEDCENTAVENHSVEKKNQRIRGYEDNSA